MSPNCLLNSPPLAPAPSLFLPRRSLMVLDVGPFPPRILPRLKSLAPILLVNLCIVFSAVLANSLPLPTTSSQSSPVGL